MPEEQLNGANVGAGFQEMYGERVAQRMRRDRLWNARTPLRPPAGAADRMRGDRFVWVMLGA
jgi:hypothetical protein